MTPKTLKAIRLLHLYSGVFLAPAILFFAITGGLQTFSLHETTRGSSYVPPALIVHLSELHKKATLIVPPTKLAKPDAQPKSAASAAPKSPAPPPQPAHIPMKIFFEFVALGLILSTISGLIMAWKYARNKAIPVTLFFAGIALPALLLLF